MRKLHRLYTLRALPVLGKLVAGDSESYKYLGESIEVHPDQDALDFMLIKSGFREVKHYNLMGGVVAVHVGWKV
jgi:demethylmenaquinone methyltransferase/2-methoxy-6-polyprenyl-1,4-benzoquinol methylase